MIKVTKYRELPVSVWKKVPFWIRVRHYYIRYWKFIVEDLKEILELTLLEFLLIPFKLIILPLSGFLLVYLETLYKGENIFSWYYTYNVHPKLIECKWSSTEYTREELGDVK